MQGRGDHSMSSPHADPASHGHTFGKVTVTIDLNAGDCVLHVDALGYAMKRPRFHSVEEIQGAYQVQHGLAATDPIAADVARALNFAGYQLLADQEGRRRG